MARITSRIGNMGAQPSTSSPDYSSLSPKENKSKLIGLTYTYDIILEIQINVPIGYNTACVISAVSATLITHIFVNHPGWNALATPILRILDSALERKTEDWVITENRLITTATIHIMGHLVNITEPTKISDSTYDVITYNGCVDERKVMLNYKIRMSFNPATPSAIHIYEAHLWARDDTPQIDDARSLKVKQILNHHCGCSTIDHEFTWNEIYGYF